MKFVQFIDFEKNFYLHHTHKHIQKKPIPIAISVSENEWLKKVTNMPTGNDYINSIYLAS